MKKLTFLIDEDLHRKFKVLCIEQGKTMVQLLNDMIRTYVTKSEKREK